MCICSERVTMDKGLYRFRRNSCMTTYTSTCVICESSFEASTSYGLCPMCWQKDRLREFDRLQSATYHAEKARLPHTLTLFQWLGVLSDFNAHCAYCLVEHFNEIDMVVSEKGLVRGNVVPICRSCVVHKRNTFDVAYRRVQGYLLSVPTQYEYIPRIEREEQS